MRTDWFWYRDEIQKGVAFSERYCRDLLQLVPELRSLVGEILARQTSFASDRPQDYVASILVTRAFRLTISSLYLGLGGYPDSATNLDRTVWEIGVRLLDMSEAPAAAALGFLLDGATSEIASMEAELEHRRREGLPVGYLHANLDGFRQHYESLARLASKRGLDHELIRQKHGRLNVREVCKRFGIEKAYLVDYAFTTGHVHEKNLATSGYMLESDEERRFHLGPIGVPGGPAAIAIDELTNFSRVLAGAARIVEDEELIKRSDEILLKLADVRERLESEEGPGAAQQGAGADRPEP